MNTSEVIKGENTEWITCSNCNKKLLRTPSNQSGTVVLYNIYIDCPFCGDKSFDFPIKGPFKTIPADDVRLKQWKDLGNNRCKFETIRVSK